MTARETYRMTDERLEDCLDSVYLCYAQYHGLEYDEARAFIEDSGAVPEISDDMPEYVYGSAQRIAERTDIYLKRYGVEIPETMLHESLNPAHMEDLVHTNPKRYDPVAKAWVDEGAPAPSSRSFPRRPFLP